MIHILLNQKTIVEKLMAESINRMYGLIDLAQEQVSIENDTLDSDLDLTSEESLTLHRISDYLTSYPVFLGGRSSVDAEQATVNMLIGDRDVPDLVTNLLSDILHTLVQKNHMVLTLEPNSPEHQYIESHEKAYFSDDSLDKVNLQELYPSKMGFIADTGHSHRGEMFQTHNLSKTPSAEEMNTRLQATADALSKMSKWSSIYSDTTSNTTNPSTHQEKESH